MTSTGRRGHAPAEQGTQRGQRRGRAGEHVVGRAAAVGQRAQVADQRKSPGLRPRAHGASLLDPVCAHPDHLQVLRPALARQVPEQQSDAWLHVAPEGRHAPGVVVVVLLVVVVVEAPTL